MPPKRRVFVGKCVYCGVSLYYNEDEDKLVVGRGALDGCAHRYEWPEDGKEGKEDEITN